MKRWSRSCAPGRAGITRVLAGVCKYCIFRARRERMVSWLFCFLVLWDNLYNSFCNVTRHFVWGPKDGFVCESQLLNINDERWTGVYEGAALAWAAETVGLVLFVLVCEFYREFFNKKFILHSFVYTEHGNFIVQTSFIPPSVDIRDKASDAWWVTPGM